MLHVCVCVSLLWRHDEIKGKKLEKILKASILERAARRREFVNQFGPICDGRTKSRDLQHCLCIVYIETADGPIVQCAEVGWRTRIESSGRSCARSQRVFEHLAARIPLKVLLPCCFFSTTCFERCEIRVGMR